MNKVNHLAAKKREEEREQEREYVDKDREVMSDYYDMCERYGGGYSKLVETQMRSLIEKDPDYFEPYLLLYDMLNGTQRKIEAEKLLNDAYSRAVKLITDKDGKWPDVLEWGWLENRHIIRTILNKGISSWVNGKTDDALDLFRRLLRMNPRDNAGVRDYILAIRMDMTFDGFERRFNKGGFYDMKLMEWFDKNYKKFPDEFGWWEKAA